MPGIPAAARRPGRGSRNGGCGNWRGRAGLYRGVAERGAGDDLGLTALRPTRRGRARPARAAEMGRFQAAAGQAQSGRRPRSRTRRCPAAARCRPAGSGRGRDIRRGRGSAAHGARREGAGGDGGGNIPIAAEPLNTAEIEAVVAPGRAARSASSRSSPIPLPDLDLRRRPQERRYSRADRLRARPGRACAGADRGRADPARRSRRREYLRRVRGRDHRRRRRAGARAAQARARHDRDEAREPAVAHLYIENPLNQASGMRGTMRSLFDTHPPLTARIAALEEAGGFKLPPA